MNSLIDNLGKIYRKATKEVSKPIKDYNNKGIKLLENKSLKVNFNLNFDLNFENSLEFKSGCYSEKNQVTGRVFNGNNLDIGRKLNFDESIDNFQFIYLDPPFFSQRDYFSKVEFKEELSLSYRTFNDKKNDGIESYLGYLTKIIFLGRKMLNNRGTMAVHLDWHSSHYVKILMDEIFGYNNFINEIIWQYKSGGGRKRGFSRKYDSILIYSKSEDFKFNHLKEKSYNRLGLPYGFKDIDEFQDEHGWYTMVNHKDIWNIDMVGRTSRERTGYATQKPEKLIRMLIKAFTNEGDLVGDLFLGSGTTVVEALKLNRNAVGCDMSKLSIKTVMERILNSRDNGLIKGTVDFIYCDLDKNKNERCKARYKIVFKDNKAKIKLVKLMENTIEEQLRNFSMKDRKVFTENFGKNKKEHKKHYFELIKIVSIDCNYNGRVHNSQIVSKSVKEGEIHLNKVLESGAYTKIHVVTVDAFGNIGQSEVYES